MSRIVRTRLAAAAVGLSIAVASAVLALGSEVSLDSKTLGAVLELTSNATSTAGATLAVGGTIDDHGTSYGFNLNANESSTPGEGNVTLFLNGNDISLCTVHGPGADPDGFPLTQVQCGGAARQAVSISGCRAAIEAHGFSHSDFPREAIYLGSMTVEVSFQKTAANAGNMKVTVYTPKRAIKIEGPVTFSGSMPTCP